MLPVIWTQRDAALWGTGLQTGEDTSRGTAGGAWGTPIHPAEGVLHPCDTRSTRWTQDCSRAADAVRDMTSHDQAEPHGHVSGLLHRHQVWAEKSKEADQRPYTPRSSTRLTHAPTCISGGYR